MNAQTGIINIRGKEYQTVALRVQLFREMHPLLTLESEVVFRDDETVVMKARIADLDGRTIATGHAEEKRAASQINRTSALENAETSAIGRALAAFGFGGTEFATANEVQNAIHQQAAGGQSKREVSPPPQPENDRAARGRNNGPTKSKLDAAEAEIIRELMSCEDEATLIGYLETDEYKAAKALLEEYRPSAIYGPPPADCPEYVPIRAMVSRMVSEFRAATPQDHPFDAK